MKKCDLAGTDPIHSSAALSNITRTSYYPTGQVEAVWGDQTYATFCLYDEQNRRTGLRTYRSLGHGTKPLIGTAGYDETRWSYHTQRGWLSAKEYPDGQDADTVRDPGPAYGYTAAGRLKTRQWARTLPSSSTRLLAEYGYDQGKLSTVSYNDTLTPALEYTYDAFGRPLKCLSLYKLGDRVVARMRYCRSG